jgi:hypothetical protein
MKSIAMFLVAQNFIKENLIISLLYLESNKIASSPITLLKLSISPA